MNIDINMDKEIAASVMVLAERMLAKQAWLATAESCTGGMIAQVVTDLPGSSGWFDRGFVTYSNDAKQQLLDVSTTLLAELGAVSEACVEQMARGALAHSKADYVIACSGIAGPGGGTPDKPVGTVWMAWAYQTKLGVSCISQRFCFDGDRHEIRQQTTLAGLQGLLKLLN